MIRFSELRDRDFRKLALGAAFNAQGMIGEQVVLGFLVFELEGSTASVGILLALYFLPFFVFGLASGAIADHLDRRSLLRRVEAATAANLALFAVIVSAFDDLTWLAFVFALATGSLRAMQQPVRSSYAYDLVGGDRVVPALALLNLMTRFGQLAGALGAGMVMHSYGAGAALILLSLGHLVAFGFYLGLREAGRAAVTARTTLSRNIRDYIQELRANRLLLSLLLVTATVEVFGFSFATALPELAVSRLELDAEGLGFLQAFRAAGGIAAGLLLVVFPITRHRGLAYVGVIAMFGAGLLILAQATGPLVTLGAAMLIASMAAASDILTQSMMQLSVPNALRGRAMGVWALSVGFGPIGHLELGLLAGLIGLSAALAVNGGVLLIAALAVVIALPRLRRF